MNITQYNENTWIFDEGEVRFFLLTGTKEALLIDSGMQTKNAKEMAGDITKLPIKLLNTHADPDHIGSNGEFEEFYMNPAEAGNYYKSHKGSGKMIPIEDKDTLDLGDRPLEIISLPGHTPGSIAVLDVKGRLLFSGDPIQDGNIFMFGDQREMHAYILSMEKIIKMQDRFDHIMPSHGTCPVDKEIMPKLKEAAEGILAGKYTGRQHNLFGQTVTCYDVFVARFLYD